MHNPLDFINSLENDADYLSVAFSYGHLIYGSHWGFDNHNEFIDCEVVYNEYLSQLETNTRMKAHLKMYKLAKGGYLIETSNFTRPNNILFKAFGSNPQNYNNNEIALGYRKALATDLLTLNELLSSGHAGTVAIYNTSQGNEFIVKGRVFPAFRVTAKLFMNLLSTYNYSVRYQNGLWVAVDDIESIEEFLQEQEKTPSGDGLMVHIQPTSRV